MIISIFIIAAAICLIIGAVLFFGVEYFHNLKLAGIFLYAAVAIGIIGFLVALFIK